MADSSFHYGRERRIPPFSVYRKLIERTLKRERRLAIVA
jgi:hypothetical protein